MTVGRRVKQTTNPPHDEWANAAVANDGRNIPSVWQRDLHLRCVVPLRQKSKLHSELDSGKGIAISVVVELVPTANLPHFDTG